MKVIKRRSFVAGFRFLVAEGLFSTSARILAQIGERRDVRTAILLQQEVWEKSFLLATGFVLAMTGGRKTEKRGGAVSGGATEGFRWQAVRVCGSFGW